MGIKYSTYQQCDTVPKKMKMFSEVAPERELFVFYDKDQRYPYTSRQIYRLAGKFASQLHQRGFNHHDVISNTLPNSPERVITDLGIVMAGCISMNGQILLADGEDFFMSANVARCKATVVWDDDVSLPWKLIKDYVTSTTSGIFAEVTCERASDLKRAILVRRNQSGSGKQRNFLQELEESDLDIYLDPDQEPGDTMIVQTTSGSTGYSKLVPRTHQEVINTSTSTLSPQTTDSEIVNFRNSHMYTDKPMGWVGGFPFSTYCLGDKRVLRDVMASNTQSMDAGSVWNTIRREGVTMASLPMQQVNSIISYLDKTSTADEYKLPMLICAGQPVRESQFKAAFQIAETLIPSYGSSELAYVSADFVSDDESAKLTDFYCGKVLPQVQVKILNNTGDVCKPGEVGSLFVKGGNIFKGYFNLRDELDEATENAFTPDGWFKTEDNGFWDKEGGLHVLGRDNDVICYGSYLVYPGWLEERISRHPDVVEAYVVPVSDPIQYHKICACVVLTPGSSLTEEKLKKFCDKLFLTSRDSILTPTPEFFMILDECPVTMTEKSDRKFVKKLAEERFGTNKATNNTITDGKF